MASDAELGDPALSWDDNGSPHCGRFNDIYFNPTQGEAESRYVFAQGCDLPQAWRSRQRFVIGETGFGTGLNFLTTYRLWRQHRKAGQYLHYVAVEGFPLSAGQLQRAAAGWPTLASVAKRLIAHYPLISAGYHRIHMDDDRVTLTLMFGQVLDVLTQLEAQVDAWYLDGFAPRCNPDMWCPQVLQQIARVSAPGARLATFTAAGEVRRGLRQVGFEVLKGPGFGAKRERLLGRFAGPPPASLCPPWYGVVADSKPISEPVMIIGAGLAASSVTKALHRRGIESIAVGPPAAASANPRANVMPRLALDRSAPARLFWAAYRYALRHWQDSSAWTPCGSLLLATDQQQQQRYNELQQRWRLPSASVALLDAAHASEIAGLRLQQGGLWFAEAGWVDGSATAAAVGQINARVQRLECLAGRWQASDEGHRCVADSELAVLACGWGAASLLPCAHLPLHGYYGQMSFFQPSRASAPLRTSLMAGACLTPVHQGCHSLGSTFERASSTAPTRDYDDGHQRNRMAWHRSASALPEVGEPSAIWSAVRATTPDRLPLVGPLHQVDQFERRFEGLKHSQQRAAASVPLASSLFALLGLGARGFTTAALGAELMVSQMLGDPWPVERELALSVHPSRFMVRQLKRG